MARSFCVSCNKRISEKRPVFLVRYPSGKIVGPMHSWCSAVIAHEDYTDHGALNTYIESAAVVGQDDTDGK